MSTAIEQSVANIITKIVKGPTIARKASKGSNLVEVNTSRRLYARDNITITSGDDEEFASIDCIINPNTIRLCEPVSASWRDASIEKVYSNEPIAQVLIADPTDLAIQTYPCITINHLGITSEEPLTLTDYDIHHEVQIDVFTSKQSNQEAHAQRNQIVDACEIALRNYKIILIEPWFQTTLGEDALSHDSIIKIAPPNILEARSNTSFWLENKVHTLLLQTRQSLSNLVYQLAIPIPKFIDFLVEDTKVIRPQFWAYDAGIQSIEKDRYEVSNIGLKSATINYHVKFQMPRLPIGGFLT